MLDLTNARVTGFYSLPSPELAGRNPEAYNYALRNAPKGAGMCQHCGTGIMHNVIVTLADGSRAVIGSTCAEKVGSERTRRCVRERLTDEQLVKREADRAERQRLNRERDEQLAREHRATVAARVAEFADVLETLRFSGNEFYSSLADQLEECGSLSRKQAIYVCKMVVGRETKKNSEAWWTLHERLTNDRN